MAEGPRTDNPKPYPQQKNEILEDPEQQKLAEINEQLKNKLLEFKKQTEINVMNAKLEIGKLMVQLQAIEGNKQSLIEQLNQLNSRLFELEEAQKSSQAQILAVKFLKTEKNNKAVEFRAFSLARSVFGKFRHAINLIKKEHKIQARIEYNLKSVTFHILKQQRLITALFKHKQAFFIENLKRKSITLWKSYINRKKNLSKLVSKMNFSRNGYKTILGLKQNANKNKRKSEFLKISDYYKKRLLFRKIIKGLIFQYKNNNLDSKTELNLLQKVYFYLQFPIKRQHNFMKNLR